MSTTENVNVSVSDKETTTLPSVPEDKSVTEETDTSSNTNNDKIDLLSVNVTDDNTALNVLVGFLGIAQRRGVFAINESAKIFECIQQFQKSTSDVSSSE
tara:strand:+ start:269 stop:568 length:300 start_codon:yes stop_codon:yes gene_type:complete